MYIYGASGHAKVIFDIIQAMGQEVECIFDDNPQIVELNGHIISHSWNGESPIIIGIGNNEIRKKIASRLNCEFATAIHPSAVVASSAKIGEGTAVMHGAIIQPDAKIGKHCIINTGASVDHECVIEDYVHISPHATLCGNVHVGEGTWIGAGATVIPGVTIGKWCVIGAGSVVLKDIPDNTTAYGNPCKSKL